MFGIFSELVHRIEHSKYKKQKKAQKKAEDKIKKAKKADERNARTEAFLDTVTANESDFNKQPSETSKITKKDIETAKKKPSKVGDIWTGLVAKVTGFIEAIPITVIVIQIICIILVIALIALIIFSFVSMIANSLVDTIALEGAAFDWNNAYSAGFNLEEDVDDDGYRHMKIRVPGSGTGGTGSIDSSDGSDGGVGDFSGALGGFGAGFSGASSSGGYSMDIIDFWCSLTDDVIKKTAEKVSPDSFSYRVQVMNNLRMVRMAYRMCYPDGSANLGSRLSAMTPELLLGIMCSEKGYSWMSADYNGEKTWYVVKSGKMTTVSSSSDASVYNVDVEGYAGQFTHSNWLDGPFSFSAYCKGAPEDTGVDFTEGAINKWLSKPKYATFLAKLIGLAPSGHDSFEFKDYYKANYGWVESLLTGDYTEGKGLAMYTSSTYNPFIISAGDDISYRNLFLSMFVTVCAFSEWYDPSTDTGRFITGGGWFDGDAYTSAYEEFTSKFPELTASFKADLAVALFYPNMHHIPGWDNIYGGSYCKIAFNDYDVNDYRRGQLWLAASALYEAGGSWFNIRHLSVVDLETMQQDYDNGRLYLIPDVGGMHGSVAGAWFYFPSKNDSQWSYVPTYDEFKKALASSTYSGMSYEPLSLNSDKSGEIGMGTSLWNWLINNSDCYNSAPVSKDDLLKPMVHSLGLGGNTHAFDFEGVDAVIQGGEVSLRSTYIVLGIMAGGKFDESMFAVFSGIDVSSLSLKNPFVLGGKYYCIDGNGGYKNETKNLIFPLDPYFGLEDGTHRSYSFSSRTGRYADGFRDNSDHGALDIAGVAPSNPKGVGWQAIEDRLKRLFDANPSATFGDCQAALKELTGDPTGGMFPVYACADGYITTETWGVTTGDYPIFVGNSWATCGNSIYMTIKLEYPNSAGYKLVQIQYMHLSLLSKFCFDPSINAKATSRTTSSGTPIINCSVHKDNLKVPVKCGQLIGYASSTGYSTGPHLHFGGDNSWKMGNASHEYGLDSCVMFFGKKAASAAISSSGSSILKAGGYYALHQEWYITNTGQKWSDLSSSALNTLTSMYKELGLTGLGLPDSS